MLNNECHKQPQAGPYHVCNCKHMKVRSIKVIDNKVYTISLVRTIWNASLVTALKGKGRYQMVRLLLDYISQHVTSPKPVYFSNNN